MTNETLRHGKELLLKLFFEHGAAENAGDVDRVMATLCDNPYYELFPINYRMEGTVAVREFYNRMFSNTHPGTSDFQVTDIAGNLGDLRSPVDVLWMGNDSMVSRDDCILVDADGKRSSARYMAIFTLQGHLLKGETIFMSAAAAEHIRATLGPDFLDVPGVSPIL